MSGHKYYRQSLLDSVSSADMDKYKIRYPFLFLFFICSCPNVLHSWTDITDTDGDADMAMMVTIVKRPGGDWCQDSQ